MLDTETLRENEIQWSMQTNQSRDSSSTLSFAADSMN